MGESVRGMHEGVMDDLGEEGVEEELSCGQSFDEAQGRSAARTRPRGASRWGHTRCVRRWWGNREDLATPSQPAGSACATRKPK